MAKKEKGLEASIWAQPWARPYDDHHRRFVTPSQSARSTPPPLPGPAPPPTAAPPRSTTSGALPPAQAFHRFQQACQRLRWKYVDLQSSHRRAMAPAAAGFAPADAELNFKLDYRDFYIWVEQALVLVLAVFGVAVPRGDGGPGGAVPGGHAFHHNVLRALEDEACPVHAAMGRGEVRQALWKAKELRNRWKDAAEGRETPPLKMYDLTWIVGQVLGGLEVAYGLAEDRIAEMAREADGRMEERLSLEEQGEEDGWEWMVEPMDWEP